MTSNEPIAYLGIPSGLSPTVIVMMHGNVPFLKQMIKHFTSFGISFNLRADLELAMDQLQKKYDQDYGTNKRQLTLIDHSLWLFLIQEANIEYEHPDSLENSLKRSLLDLAVIDRNLAAAKLIIKKFGTEILNHRCTEGPLQGNCLRFIEGDLNMLKLLVANGVDINTPMNITTVYEGSDESESLKFVKETPVLARLLSMDYDGPMIEYVKTLNFSQKVVETALDFARKMHFVICAQVATDILWEKYEIRA